MSKLEKSAVLVVHGVGQQRRYSTLVKVANEFQKSWGANEKWEATPPLETPPGARRGVRFPFPTHHVDFFEYYWAPLTAGKTSIGKVLRWLYRQTFARFAQLRHAPHWKTLLSVFQTVLALAFAAYVAFIVGNFAALAARAKEDGFDWMDAFSWNVLYTPSFSAAQAKSTGEWLINQEAGTLLGDLIVGAAIAYLALQGLRHAVFIIRGVGRGFSSSWTPLLQAVIYFGIFALGLLWLVGWQGDAVPFAMTVATGWFLYRFGKSFLRDYIGDAHVYGSRNEFADGYAARRSAIDEGENLLRWMLGMGEPESRSRVRIAKTLDTSADPANGTDANSAHQPKEQERPEYSQIIILAHSLGSVVALDVLRQTYLNLTREGEEKRLSNIGCFVTAGSPLALFSYLYGRDDPDENRIDSFFSGELDSIFGADGVQEWHNYWFVSDIAATVLAKSGAFSDLSTSPEDTCVGFGRPYVCHLDYWKSNRLKRHVTELLGIL